MMRVLPLLEVGVDRQRLRQTGSTAAGVVSERTIGFGHTYNWADPK